MITFQNSPVQIGDFNILAESASISLQTPARGITKFGSPGYYSQVRDGPAVGNVSVSYYMSDGDTGVRNLFTGDGVQLFDISVGPYRCYSGVANSMSMNIEPHSVVSCTLELSFYNGYDQLGDTGNIAAPTSGIAHGAASEVYTDLLWSTDIVSVNYRMDQSISPIYAVGELVPSGYTREGGTIEVDLQGTGWGHIVDTGTICEGYTVGSITLDTLCTPCVTKIQYDIGYWSDAGSTAGVFFVSGCCATDWWWESRGESASPPSWGDRSDCPPCWEVGDSVLVFWPDQLNGGVGEIYDKSTDAEGNCTLGFSWNTFPPPSDHLTFPMRVVQLSSVDERLTADPWPYTIPFSGYVVNPSVALEPNSEIVGSLTVFGVF